MRAAEELILTFLLNALWQLPLAVGLGVLAARSLRKAPARFRHALWLLVLAAGLALPLASVLRTGARAVSAPGPVPAGSRPAPAAAGPLDLGWLGLGDGALPAPARWTPFWAASASGAYLFSIAILAGRLALSVRAVRKLARGARPVASTPELQALLARCRQAFGLGEVELQVSGAVASPVTFGTLRPAIVVPEGFFSATSPDEQLAALGHEMAHVARRDYALHLLAEAVLLPLSFHPAAWLLRRRLAEAREMACDEATIERLLSARTYARSLLSLAAFCHGLPRPTPTLGVFDAGTLEVRMKRMTDVQPRMGAPRARIQIAAAALVLALAAFGASTLAIPATLGGDSHSAGAAALPELKPFLGTWRGSFPDDPKMQDPQRKKIPGANLEIEIVDGKPQVVLTLFRLHRNPDGTFDAAPLRETSPHIRVRDGALTFRIHRENFALPGETKTAPVDIDWSLQDRGRGQGTLKMVWNSRFSPAKARGENVPPPPPPLDMQKVD